MKPDLIRCETELVIYEFRTLSGGKSAKDVTQLFNVICTWASANSLKVYKYNQNQTNSTHSYSESCTVHYLKCNTSLPTTPNSLISQSLQFKMKVIRRRTSHTITTLSNPTSIYTTLSLVDRPYCRRWKFDQS